MVSGAENERRNVEAGLVSEDVGKKYMREAEERDAKVQQLLSEAASLQELAEAAEDEGEMDRALLLEVRGVRREVAALMISFQVGEKPEDESQD
jgi:hypothetical protein